MAISNTAIEIFYFERHSFQLCFLFLQWHKFQGLLSYVFYDNSSLESYQHVKEYKAILLPLSMPILCIRSLVLNIVGGDTVLENGKINLNKMLILTLY